MYKNLFIFNLDDLISFFAEDVNFQTKKIANELTDSQADALIKEMYAMAGLPGDYCKIIKFKQLQPDDRGKFVWQEITHTRAIEIRKLVRKENGEIGFVFLIENPHNDQMMSKWFYKL